jgi:hypothetical protein
MSSGRAVSVLAAAVALACTYDFDRFEAATPGSSGASGSGASGSGPSAGGTSTGGTSGEAGENGEMAVGGESGTPSTGAGGATGLSCDELGGVIHDGRCYFTIAPGTGLRWSAARETCAGYSPTSHLAAITSSEEQAAIEATLSPAVSDYWIGLSLADVESDPDDDCDESPETCPFEWVTGDALSYSNWAAHSETDLEPNYTGACVRLQLDGLTWADFDCSTRLPALCEDGG